jgi:DNA-directed RNA polymerase subunit RPC12/RpoP
MAQIDYYTCENCGFSTSRYIRLRRETMLKQEGFSSFFCISCKEKVNVYAPEDPVCPQCGKNEFIGLNTNTCPYCNFELLEEDGPAF